MALLHPLHLWSGSEWLVRSHCTDEFAQTHNFIHRILIDSVGKGSTLDLGDITHKSGKITTNVIKIESHRCCSVAYVLQCNSETGVVRYLVYGIRFNEDSTYGIGRTLGDIKVDEYYPQGSTAIKHLK